MSNNALLKRMGFVIYLEGRDVCKLVEATCEHFGLEESPELFEAAQIAIDKSFDSDWMLSCVKSFGFGASLLERAIWLFQRSF